MLVKDSKDRSVSGDVVSGMSVGKTLVFRFCSGVVIDNVPAGCVSEKSRTPKGPTA